MLGAGTESGLEPLFKLQLKPANRSSKGSTLARLGPPQK
jgi:hypothetical protein